MSSITISADNLLELFDSLSLTNRGNDIFIYSDKEALGDEPGEVITLKGLAATEDFTFFGAYTVEAESSSIDEVYLSAESIGTITSIVALIAEKCAPDEEELNGEEGDEDFYVPVKLDFTNEDDGSLFIKIDPATGDEEKDKKVRSSITQGADEDLSSNFPAAQIASVIRGEHLDEAPSFVDKFDANDEALPVPDGRVTVWASGANDPLNLALKKARSMKLPLAVERHHASRIHGIRIGELWFGAVAPVPLNSSDMTEQGIFADTESLNAEYDFNGLREKDDTVLEEPTQYADELEDEDLDEESDSDFPVDEESTDEEPEELEETDDDEEESFDTDLSDEDEIDHLVDEYMDEE